MMANISIVSKNLSLFICCNYYSWLKNADMEFLEVLTEGLERVLLVRGGGSEVITIYSWLPINVIQLMRNWTVEQNAVYMTQHWLSQTCSAYSIKPCPTSTAACVRQHRSFCTCHYIHIRAMMVMSMCRNAVCQTSWYETHTCTQTYHSGIISVVHGLTQEIDVLVDGSWMCVYC